MNKIMDIQVLVDDIVRGGPDQDFSKLGKITAGRHYEDPDLLLLRYTHEAQFTPAPDWNQRELLCRGLIVNAKTGEIVARPFDKFWNYGQSGLYPQGHITQAREKMDGSLGILYRHNGEHHIATRGSFTSDQALWATYYLNENYDLSYLDDSLTLLFEIIYPENRIVLDYGKREDLVLLATRNRFSGKYVDYARFSSFAVQYGFNIPLPYVFNSSSDIVYAAQNLIDKEGWVVEYSDGSRWKFKGDQYVELHRWLARFSYKVVLEAMRDGKLDDLQSVCPPEYKKELEIYEAAIRIVFVHIRTAISSRYLSLPLETSRKEIALIIQAEHKAYAKFLFSLLDKKDIDVLIYNAILEEHKNEDRMAN